MKKIVWAWHAISHLTNSDKHIIEISANDYAILRRKIAESTSKRFLNHVPWNKDKHNIYSIETRLSIGAHRKGISPVNKGVPHTEATKAKIKAARAKQVLLPPTEAQKLQISLTLKEYYRNNAVVKNNYKQVIDLTTGVIYLSKSDCIRQLGIGKKMLNKCLTKNYIWNEHRLCYWKESKDENNII